MQSNEQNLIHSVPVSLFADQQRHSFVVNRSFNFNELYAKQNYWTQRCILVYVLCSAHGKYKPIHKQPTITKAIRKKFRALKIVFFRFHTLANKCYSIKAFDHFFSLTAFKVIHIYSPNMSLGQFFLSLKLYLRLVSG